MLDVIKRWVRNKKTSLAHKWLAEIGVTPVRILTRAGTDYILKNDGSLHRIGRVK